MKTSNCLARRVAQVGERRGTRAGVEVTVDAINDTVLYFIEMFPDQAAMDADMKTPLVQALLADLNELTVHGGDFRSEGMYPVLG